VSKNKKGHVRLYPEEKEGNLRDTNRKLKSQIKHLNKTIKQLESENQTLQRAFNKSVDFLKNKSSQKSLEEVFCEVESFEHKETRKGREKEKENKEQENVFEQKKSCPECGNTENNGFGTTKFSNFEVHWCSCGYKTRVNFE
jgi:predicted nuclease with TOPRIM domain